MKTSVSREIVKVNFKHFISQAYNSSDNLFSQHKYQVMYLHWRFVSSPRTKQFAGPVKGRCSWCDSWCRSPPPPLGTNFGTEQPVPYFLVPLPHRLDLFTNQTVHHPHLTIIHTCESVSIETIGGDIAKEKKLKLWIFAEGMPQYGWGNVAVQERRFPLSHHDTTTNHSCLFLRCQFLDNKEKRLKREKHTIITVLPPILTQNMTLDDIGLYGWCEE